MIKQPLQIGVTGSIGSGKSVVCNIFKTLGVPIYDADTRAKWVMVNDQSLKSSLLEEFGDEAYLETGELNRTYISSLVFNNKNELDKLNSIVHPRVALDYKNWVERNIEYKYLMKEAALLFESDSYQQLDKIIVVTAPESTRINRVLLRDSQRTKEEVQRIIETQLPESKKIERADYVVNNDETRLLTTQILDLHRLFLSM